MGGEGLRDEEKKETETERRKTLVLRREERIVVGVFVAMITEETLRPRRIFWDWEAIDTNSPLTRGQGGFNYVPINKSVI